MSDENYAMVVDEGNLLPPAAPETKAKWAHLKARTRFVADLEDLKAESMEGVIEIHGLQVQCVSSRLVRFVPRFNSWVRGQP